MQFQQEEINQLQLLASRLNTSAETVDNGLRAKRLLSTHDKVFKDKAVLRKQVLGAYDLSSGNRPGSLRSLLSPTKANTVQHALMGRLIDHCTVARVRATTTAKCNTVLMVHTYNHTHLADDVATLAGAGLKVIWSSMPSWHYPDRCRLALILHDDNPFIDDLLLANEAVRYFSMPLAFACPG